VYFTTMITEGVSYRFGNHWRACAAPVSRECCCNCCCSCPAAEPCWHAMHARMRRRLVPTCCNLSSSTPECPRSVLLPAATVAKSAGKTSQGGSVWPPGQPADIKAGRLVFNTNIHGTTFNSAAGKQTLAQFLDKLRINAAFVFPPATFGRMVLNGGSGLRLVNEPAYPCTCESALWEHGFGLLCSFAGRGRMLRRLPSHQTPGGQRCAACNRYYATVSPADG